jgi:alpha-ketoglutarate-dependent sulfate ester dioxygenase
VTTTTNPVTHVEVSPIAGNIGAELSGVDLTRTLPDETIASIRRALLEHKVVFFRGQQLTYESEVAFARRFGSLTLGHPTLPSPPDQPLLEEIDSDFGPPANQWHTDVTFVDQPPAFTFLYGAIIPPVGGDTIWANTVSAYDSLPPELRDLADRLRVVHTNAHDYASVDARRFGHDLKPSWFENAKNFVSTVYETEHPAVRSHPETGERSLVLGGFAQRVAGYHSDVARDLIRTFQEYIIRPENTVRWRWRVGDLAIWDNRATQHRAVFDYGTARRRGERVTVAGPTPIGVDGRPSVALKGSADAYYAGAA